MMLNGLNTNILLGFVIGVLVAFVLLELIRKCYISSSGKQIQQKYLRTLARQAERWTVAAEQDDNPLIAVLHANYGAGYMWAMDDIASEREIEEIIESSYDEFRGRIVRNQDKAAQQLIDKCGLKLNV